MKFDRQKSFNFATIGWLALIGLLGGCSSQSNTGPTADKRVALWPPPPDAPRIQYLVSFQKSSDIQATKSKFDELIYGKEAELPILSPYGVAMRDGKIYVCDNRGRGVTILDLKQQVTRVIGASGYGEISKAVDITIAPDGMKYVADGTRMDIVVFDATDHFAARFTHEDFNPISVAVYGNELFVTDFKNQQIKVLDRSNGKIIRTFGEPGEKDGQFIRPLSVRITPQGEVVVDDFITCRIQTFTRDGKFLKAIGGMGDSPGWFARPKHMALDSNGFLYVVDAQFSNVQIFDEEQKILMYFGSLGPHVGSMDLPAGICISEDPADIALFRRYIHSAFEVERLVIVTNQHGPDKVSVYAQGHLKQGKTLADINPSRANVTAGVSGIQDATTRPELGPIPSDEPAENQASSTQPAGPATSPTNAPGGP